MKSLLAAVSLTLFNILLASMSLAQTSLTIGDQMPDYQLINLINHPYSSAKLSSFKARLVILDFWSTNCLSCIESWPKILKLQSKFNDEVQIILVNAYQDKKHVQSIYDRRRAAGVEVTLPTVCLDTVLSRMFPRAGVPHIVWVDSGVIRAITDGGNLNEGNIRKMLTDREFKMPRAITEPPKPVDFDQPLFINNNGGAGQTLLRSSTLASNDPALANNIAMMGDRKQNLFSKVTAINCSLSELYGFAFSDRLTRNNDIQPILQNRIKFSGFEKGSYELYIDGAIQDKNLFLYQLISPLCTRAELQKEMQQDLFRIFGFDAQLKNRKVRCRELRVFDSSLLPTRSERTFMQGVTKFMFSLNGAYDFREIVMYLDRVYKETETPVVYRNVDLSAVPVGIEIELDVLNADLLDKALRKYGISFKEVRRKVNILYIRKS